MNRKIVRFGENIKILRNKKGWTQEQLANEVHVTRQTVSAWEQKVSCPDIYVLAKLHELFAITTDELVFGKLADRYQDAAIQDIIYEQEEVIRSIKKKGFYDILEEDIQEFFPIIYLRFPRVMGIVLELHELGYQITSVYSNGFGIYFPTDEAAEKFSSVLYDVIDAIIHHEVERTIVTYSEKVQDRVEEVKIEVLHDTQKLIFGAEIENMYYWVDEYDRIRGYGKNEEECKAQAREQECNEYTIMHE